MNKKEAEKFEIRLIKSKIKTAEWKLEKYTKALVKLDFLGCCVMMVGAEELWNEQLIKMIDALEDSGIKEAKKSEFSRRIMFGKGVFRERTEKEKLQGTLEWTEGLVKSAEHRLENLPTEKKEEAVSEMLKKLRVYTNNDYFNVMREIQEEKENERSKKNKKNTRDVRKKVGTKS